MNLGGCLGGGGAPDLYETQMSKVNQLLLGDKSMLFRTSEQTIFFPPISLKILGTFYRFIVYSSKIFTILHKPSFLLSLKAFYRKTPLLIELFHFWYFFFTAFVTVFNITLRNIWDRHEYLILFVACKVFFNHYTGILIMIISNSNSINLIMKIKIN